MNLRQVKTINDTDITVVVEDGATYNSTKTETVTIAKGERLSDVTSSIRDGIEYYLIDGTEYGYPGIMLEIPKEAVTPVYPWQVLGLIIILAIMLVWYVKLSIQNKTFMPF